MIAKATIRRITPAPPTTVPQGVSIDPGPPKPPRMHPTPMHPKPKLHDPVEIKNNPINTRAIPTMTKIPPKPPCALSSRIMTNHSCSCRFAMAMVWLLLKVFDVSRSGMMFFENHGTTQPQNAFYCLASFLACGGFPHSQSKPDAPLRSRSRESVFRDALCRSSPQGLMVSPIFARLKPLG